MVFKVPCPDSHIPGILSITISPNTATFFMALQLHEFHSLCPKYLSCLLCHLLTAHSVFNSCLRWEGTPSSPTSCPLLLWLDQVLSLASHVPEILQLSSVSSHMLPTNKATALRPVSLSLLPGCRDPGSEVQRLLHLRPGFFPDRTLSPRHEAPGGRCCILPLVGFPSGQGPLSGLPQAGNRSAAPAPPSLA